MTKIIYLDTKEKQKIYLNTQRQEIIRVMSISGEPMTSKDLSKIIKISSSSIKHHINKLEILGLVEESHTKLVNVILAKYYKPSDATISLGIDQNIDSDSQIAYLQNEIQGIFQRLMDKIKYIGKKIRPDGSDVISGIIHLSDEEATHLSNYILEYTKTHNHPQKDTNPREYAFILNKIEKEE